MEPTDEIRAVESLFSQLEPANGHNGASNGNNQKPNFRPLYHRLLNFGISYGDLERISGKATNWLSFSRAMGNLAEYWEKCAASAWKSGRLETPREQWKRAADYYHYAQLKLPDSLLKESFQRASRRCYERGASLLNPPAIRCDVPFQSMRLPGYLRIKRPGAPCVILIGGLDSAKEVELHYFAEIFLRRACSVFYFDGPGQGELNGKSSMACGFEKAVSAIIEFLRNDPRVGIASIGCFGVALGGYLACRTAALNPKIEACISIGGFFDSSVLPKLPPLAHPMFLKAFGFKASDDIGMVAPYVTLEPLRGQMKSPLLLVHGTADHLVDIAQIAAIEGWADGPVDKLILEGAEHVCSDRFNECLPSMGDWMTNWLFHESAQEVALI
jgi:pimeloyl-ACP methyl ester carboxylesterase